MPDKSLNRALEYVLEGLSEAEEGTFVLGWADRDTLGPDAFSGLIGAGLVRSHSSAGSVVCPGCEEACTMPVEQRETGQGHVSFIVCDKPQDLGRISLDHQHLDQWRTDIELVASCVANLMGTATVPRVLIPNGLVRLGRAEINGSDAECFLARDGSDDVFGHRALREVANPLVFHVAPIQSSDVAHLHLGQAISFKDGHLRFVADAAAKALLDAAPQAHENIFRLNGQTWEVQFQGRTTNLRHTHGIGYITELLRRPRGSLTVMELYVGARTGGRELIEAGLEVSDQRSRRTLLTAIERTQVELARARAGKALGRVGELEACEKSLQAEFARDFGKSGQARLQGPSERSRQNVQKAIRAALAGIMKVHPALGGHLKAAIRTGRDCTYNPAQPTIWKIIS